MLCGNIAVHTRVQTKYTYVAIIIYAYHVHVYVHMYAYFGPFVITQSITGDRLGLEFSFSRRARRIRLETVYTTTP